MNEVLIRNFKEKLKRKESVIGPFMKTTDPAFVEAAGYANMDFVILDMEHGPISMEQMQNNIRAAQIAGVLPVIRIPSVTEEAVGGALDIGAAALEIPQIETAEQARKAVRMAKFYPEGERGVCRFVRAAHYSVQERTTYFRQANNTLLILQIEGQKALDNLEDILDVSNIDIIFIGPYDLSQSLGVPGQTTHHLVIEEMKKIIEAARRKGIALGTFTDSYETMEMWKKAGVQYIAYSVDVGIFVEACRELTEKFQHCK